MKLHTCECCNGGGIRVHVKNEIESNSRTSNYENRVKLFNQPTICEYCDGSGLRYGDISPIEIKNK